MVKQEAISLKKSLTWMQGVALTIGAVLGSGVLVLPVLAAELAGPASLVSWLLMGLLTVPMVVVMAALAGRWPDAGGLAAYAQRAFGRSVGTIIGWLFLGAIPIAGPIVALIGANYIGTYLALSSVETALIAAGMLMMALFLNYRGISLSGKVQLGVVSIIAAILLVVIVSNFPKIETQAFVPFAPKGWVPVGVAMTILFWAFVGWEMITHLAEEFSNPARDIKLSLGVSLIVINTLYILLAIVIVGTGTYHYIDKVAALVPLVSGSWGEWAGGITAVLGFIVCYGTIHTYIAGFSRFVYAQARQGSFPSFFAELHSRYQTPHRVFWALVPIFAVLQTVGQVFSLDLTVFIQFPCASFIVIYIIGMAAAIKLLHSARLARICAMVSLAVCVVIYGFTGWAGLYPIGLGSIAYCASRRGEVNSLKMKVSAKNDF